MSAANYISIQFNTPDNLQRWNKQTEANCKLCRKQNCTLLYILTWFSKSLVEERYTWGHDSIIGVIANHLRTVIVEKNQETPAVTRTTKETFVNFVKAGQKPNKEELKKAQVMITLYKFLLRSLLECCLALWTPSKITDIQLLGIVQRTFTNIRTSLQRTDYRMKTLNINTCVQR